MTESIMVDTTNLLMILGIVAAVWALISPTSRLRLRFCLTWWDWSIAIVLVLLTHYLTFAPVLDSLGVYYSFGPWKWGLDSSSAIYLLLLFAVIYFFWRMRSPVLVRGKVHIFRELAERLQFTRRYDELVMLVEPQLPKLIRLSRQQAPFRFFRRCELHSRDEHTALLRGEPLRSTSALQRWCCALLRYLETKLRTDEGSGQAREVLQNLVTSPDLTAHLATAHPYFGLKLFEVDEIIYSDFVESYMDTLLDVPGSRLYMELKNNQNQNGGNRLALPESNRMLCFFFADAAAVLGKGLSRAVGEAVCRRLDEDDRLAERLNQPIGYYHEIGRFRCPINSGITLFEIMVHEGIHQGLQDHMWLHYFDHFSRSIMNQMFSDPGEDSYQEWPTPFHYLLYRLVSVASDWVEQCIYVKDLEIPEVTRASGGFDRHFISKQATVVLGAVLVNIISSGKLSESFKTYLLEVAIRRFVRLRQRGSNQADVLTSFTESVIIGRDFPTKELYRRQLQEVFGRIDHVLRRDAVQFKEVLDTSVR